MKLQIDKFLTLTAMMATAQLGFVACTAADDTNDTDERIEGDDDDDAGPSEGNTDDDDDDETINNVDDDEADAGEELTADDDDDEAADAGSEDVDSLVDAGADQVADAAAEGTAEGDAGSEGVDEGDAGGDPAMEGECLDGTFDPAMEAADCVMFDSCVEVVDYSGSAGIQCWDMSWTRRESVYNAFIACVNAAELVDPCDETADLTVAECAAQADAQACADADEGCSQIAAGCSEVSADECDVALAPYSSTRRADVAACVEYFASTYPEPDYEGCGLDYSYCLSPSAE